MGVSEIEAFLTHLAVEEHVAASTQNQVLSTLLFLYREVLGKDLERPIDLHPCPQSGRHGRSQPVG